MGKTKSHNITSFNPVSVILDKKYLQSFSSFSTIFLHLTKLLSTKGECTSYLTSCQATYQGSLEIREFQENL